MSIYICNILQRPHQRRTFLWHSVWVVVIIDQSLHEEHLIDIKSKYSSLSLQLNSHHSIFKTNAHVGVLGSAGHGSSMGVSSGYGGSNASGLMTSNGDLANDSTMSHQQSRHLLDDSVIEEKTLPGDAHGTSQTEVILAAVVGKDQNGLRDANNKDAAVLEYQGCIRRKTLLKEGRKPAVASWQRYWLQVWANHLVFFPPKTFKG